MAKEKKETTDGTIYAIYGDKYFLKIKQGFAIDKIIFSFVDKDNHINCIDCYLDIYDFALLMKKIRNGAFERAYANEKARTATEKAGDPNKTVYSKNIWPSRITYGGCQLKNGVNNYTGSISRYFTIAPGLKQEIVFNARMYPADFKDGLYSPKKGAQPLLNINVGCMYEELEKLQIKWDYIEKQLFEEKNSPENFISEYEKNNRGINDAQAGVSSNPNSNSLKPQTNQQANQQPKPQTNQQLAPSTSEPKPQNGNNNQAVAQKEGQKVEKVKFSGKTPLTKSGDSTTYYMEASVGSNLVCIVFPKDAYTVSKKFEEFKAKAEVDKFAFNIDCVKTTSNKPKYAAIYYFKDFSN